MHERSKMSAQFSFLHDTRFPPMVAVILLAVNAEYRLSRPLENLLRLRVLTFNEELCFLLRCIYLRLEGRMVSETAPFFCCRNIQHE